MQGSGVRMGGEGKDGIDDLDLITQIPPSSLLNVFPAQPSRAIGVCDIGPTPPLVFDDFSAISPPWNPR